MLSIPALKKKVCFKGRDRFSDLRFIIIQHKVSTFIDVKSWMVKCIMKASLSTFSVSA